MCSKSYDNYDYILDRYLSIYSIKFDRDSMLSMKYIDIKIFNM